MPELDRALVEQWLDDNPEAATEWFIRRADLKMVNKWLVANGFLSVMLSSRKESFGPITPADRLTVGSFNEEGPKRTNSKKHLRHNFAMAKSKSVFRTCEAASTSLAAQARRTSFRAMRKYSSLPPSSNYMLCLLIESKVHLPRYESITLELKKQLRQRDVKEFFLDIVKDIANDLDLRSLTQKIIDNLTVLLNADGASLYLVHTLPSGKKSLVSKVFDVHSGTNLFPGYREDDAVEVPWGKGVLGHVAATGEAVNLDDAAKDSRYNDEVDRIRGYHTGSLLCLPVKNAEGNVIAVAQVINRNSDDGSPACFTTEEEKLFETYLQFVGIGIINAKLMEASQAEYERNRSLLEVVHDLFEQQTSLENIVLKTLQRAQRLLQCERAAVLLLEEGCQKPKFSKMFELASSGSEMVNENAKEVEANQMATHLLQLAEQVATSGKNVNIAETIEVMKGSGANVKSLLAIPVRNPACQIIGVAKIINKLNNQPFDENDEHLFEAFTIFCGLGIHNTMMYNQLEKAMARQKVAIEVLSYHATASAEEVRNLMSKRIPEAWEWRLGTLTFDDFSLSQDEMVLASARMFRDLGLVSRLRINPQMLIRWLITVKRNYRNVPYHNWRHAFNVAHVMFTILTTCEMRCHLSDLETLGMFVGCICHDLDHRGTNNAFQEKTGSALALLYGTQNTMEHHHFNHAIMILNSEGHNILSYLTSNEYSQVMTIIKDSILATDLTIYFQIRERFYPIVDAGEFSWEIESHREMCRSLMMTACDLGASTKPWEIQKKVAERVTSEFFEQGDLEKTKLKVTPQALMDRDKQHELPLLQMRWLKDICLPLYDVLSKVNSKLMPMREGTLKNMILWARLVHDTQNTELPDLSDFADFIPNG